MKLNFKKMIGLIGAFLFAFSMMIGNIPKNVTASGGEVISSSCNGSGIQCASHLPGRLPKTVNDQ